MASPGRDGINKLLEMQKQLMEKVPHDVTPLTSRRMVSGLGIIEETLEYLNSTGHKPWRPNPLPRKAQLEEITDILFFYLEMVILSTFDWAEIEEEYVRKHAVNLERYRKAKEGDYSWDERAQGGL